MSDNSLIAILASSFGLLGIVSFALKKLVERTIAHQFSKRDEQIRQQLNLMAHLKKQFFESQLKIYSELFELIYKSRNLARDLKSGTETGPDASTAFDSICHEYTMTLYTVRFDLPELLFNKVHSYKLLLIEMANAWSSNSIATKDGTTCTSELTNSQRSAGDIYNEINCMHKEILGELQKRRDEILASEQLI